jgi:predicted RNA binding protein YcfA (HicA-like mRNA interferase family)
MKRREVIRRIETAGAVLLREGGRHSIYLNPRTNLRIPVPRHPDIAERLAKKIIADAEE